MAKIGRNEPCYCGSGRKFKKCCLSGDKKSGTDIYEQSPGAQALKQRVLQRFGNGSEFIEAPHDGVKMSDVITEFAEDLLDKTETDSQVEKVLALACTAWNFALFEESYRNKGIEETCKKLGDGDTRAEEDLRNIIIALVHHKLSNYAHIHRYILDYQIGFSGRDMHFNVVSTVIPKESVDAVSLAN